MHLEGWGELLDVLRRVEELGVARLDGVLVDELAIPFVPIGGIAIRGAKSADDDQEGGEDEPDDSKDDLGGGHLSPLRMAIISRASVSFLQTHMRRLRPCHTWSTAH